MSIFYDLILGLLKFFHRITGNFGIDILLLTLFFKIITYPLTRKSMLAMKKMATLSPLMQELQTRYKDEPQKLQAEMGKLYREKGINPLAGCLPMVLQIPIFILLYTVLRDPTLNNYIFVNADFLGMDLGTNPLTRITPDFLHNFSLTLPGTVLLPPFTFWPGSPTLPYNGVIYIPALALLIFMLVTQFLSTFLSSASMDKNQRTQTLMFNVLFIWFGITVPAGVLLYWTAQNLIGILQQWLINKEHEKTLEPASGGKK